MLLFLHTDFAYDEGPKEGSGSRFNNTVYFFRSGSGSLVTVTDQRVDSRKRQSQPYLLLVQQSAFYLGFVRRQDSLLFYLYSRSTRLDSASRRANRALSMLDCCYILLFLRWNSLTATANWLGISTNSNVFEICLRHAARTYLEGSPKPTLSVKNTKTALH